MKNNSLLEIKVTNKNGKEYKNLYITLTLDNGKVVKFQVKQSFYNKKFAYLLEKNLPIVK